MMSTRLVTIFKNIKDTEAPFFRPVEVMFARIKDGANKDLVTRIRKEKVKSERQELKKGLPAVCFSGQFSKRLDSALIEHSGLICLDFDGYTTTKEVLHAKEMLSNDKYTYAVFISPSGNGLKVIVKIPEDPENHLGYFRALDTHHASPNFDRVSRNISRVCYESYDPQIYINENSEVWDVTEEAEYVEVSKLTGTPTIPISDEGKIVEILTKWWFKKYPMTEGHRNKHLYVLAMAFNEYGISRQTAEQIAIQYISKDFGAAEVKTTLDSAYSKTDLWMTKYYEDHDKVDLVRTKLKRGLSKKEIKCQLEEMGIENDAIDSVITRIESEESEHIFWHKDDKGKVTIVPVSFKQFLEHQGYHKYCPEGGKNHIFVKVTNNLIDHTSEQEIKDFVLNYLLELDDISIYNYFATSVRFFREEFLTLLKTIEIFFIADTTETAYLYYRNCAVKVTRSRVTPIDYLELGGYVWKEHIIDRKFRICEDVSCDYKTFIARICNSDKSRINTMESTIGFMLHGHKNLSYCPAVILNDEVISDNPEGGTGKGLFMNALSQMKKLVVIDGKQFAFEKSFPYQLVSADTQLLCFDDVKKHFDFERLFSVVTEGLTLEKKNKDAIKIPFYKSPKIAITTNYAIKGSGNSFARRKWEVELHQHYNMANTPLDEFGKHFFAEWSEDEWCQFDNYMVSCLQSYLKTGLVKSKFVNLKIRQLSAETSHEFIEWCGMLERSKENHMLRAGAKLRQQDLYYDFTNEYPDYGPKSKMTISRQVFYRWLAAYAKFVSGMNPDEGRDSIGKWMIIREVETVEPQAKIDF
jgi:hypothetical protein